jgi:hypothetical protein
VIGDLTSGHFDLPVESRRPLVYFDGPEFPRSAHVENIACKLETRLVIHEHASEFAGRPVKDYDPKIGLTDPTAFGYRLSIDYDAAK